MVAGRLQEKKGYLYVVLSYVDKDGKRKQPWFKTGLKAHGNKRKAEEILAEIKKNFNINTGKLNKEESQETTLTQNTDYSFPKDADILVGDYMYIWLERI